MSFYETVVNMALKDLAASRSGPIRKVTVEKLRESHDFTLANPESGSYVHLLSEGWAREDAVDPVQGEGEKLHLLSRPKEDTP